MHFTETQLFSENPVSTHNSLHSVFGRFSRPNAGPFIRKMRTCLRVLRNIATTIVDPALIVRVRTANVLPEEQWVRAGLTVLGQDDNNAVILFASDADLTEFRSRLEAYSQGIPTGQKSP